MITQEELKSVLRFQPENGRFYWKVRRRGLVYGQEAGSFDAHGYGQLVINKVNYKEHHLVWLWMTGKLPDNQIDHLNHHRRDNRPHNLREATNAENHWNRPMQRNNTSGFVGVSFKKKIGLYEAYITHNAVRIPLGLFKDIDDAIEARKKANIEYGFHENHGKGFGVSKNPVSAKKQAEKRKRDRELSKSRD